jgi:hypothetical protein
MNAAEIRAAYARELKQTVGVRRYTGAGSTRPRFDAFVRAKATQEGATELIGTVAEFDWIVIVLVEDLIAAQFALPLTTNDKLVVAGKELAIVNPKTRPAPDGTIVAYEIRAR